VQKNLAKKLTSKNMKIEINTNSNDHHILGNEDELLQLFSNLLENSFKYGHENSEINVSIQKTKNNEDHNTSLFRKNIIEVEIKDQSDGIPEKYIHRLTERFFRVDKSRSKAIEGTGLGLTIVKHILNKHRGNIEISSTLNKGSIFTIQLPEAPIS
jgi:two-component system phosphate regulon sensor histidine kinase PhoR